MAERQPKLSLIIPVYNTDAVLSLCLSSCIRQTLYDIEILCIDDGSTDRSPTILREFAAEDPRVIISSKPNGGASSARNTGLRQARGELILFLDSDDYLSLNACERIWEEYLNTGADIFVFGLQLFPKEPRAPAWYYRCSETSRAVIRGFHPTVLFDRQGSWPFIGGKAIRRHTLTRHALFFREQLNMGEDGEFLMRLFPHGKVFAYLDDKLYHYRWCRADSAMGLNHEDRTLLDQQHFAVVDSVMEYWYEQGWLPRWCDEFLSWMLRFLIPVPKKASSVQIDGIRQLLEKYSLAEALIHYNGQDKNRKMLVLNDWR